MALTTYEGLLEAWADGIETVEQNLENLHGPATITPVLPSVTTEDGILEFAAEQTELAAWNFAKLYNQVATESGSTYTITVPSTALFYGGMVKIGGACVRDNNVILTGPVSKVVSKDAAGNIIDTLVVPDDVQALAGYGHGVSGVYNYIDFANKKFVQNVDNVDMGTLSWNRSTTGVPSFTEAVFYAAVTDMSSRSTNNTPQNIVTEAYQTDADNILYIGTMHDMSALHNTNRVYIADSENASLTAVEFKSLMSGKKLFYSLSTPVETDISAYLTDTDIKIVPGGTLTFVNANELDVASEVEYIV